MSYDCFDLLRKNVHAHVRRAGELHAAHVKTVLEIGPEHSIAREAFPEPIVLHSLDIAPHWNPTYVRDICDPLCVVDVPEHDLILCTEVLEHVNQPFQAVKNLQLLVKPGGWIFGSTPMYVPVHAPFPDNWRFTAMGLMTLFAAFAEVHVTELQAPEFAHLPLHYTFVARRPGGSR